MSLFGFFAKKTPAASAPTPPPPNLVHVLVAKRSLYPLLPAAAGQGKVLARQLDATLMKSGFKLSPALLAHVGSLDFPAALAAATDILAAVRQLLGDHVKHNPYFKAFPRDVPDTAEFWLNCLLQHYINGRLIYGERLHAFDKMVALHPKLVLKPGVRLKVIDLGGSLESELQALFAGLAGATIPLNVEDRLLLATLFAAGCRDDVPVSIRENKAILNALRLGKGQPIQVDTVVDVLRLACALSEGDVTLAKPTKFRSFPRPVRRRLVEALDELVGRDPRKLDDANNYKERFKRLAEKLHPREHARCVHAARLFDFTGGRLVVETFNRQVHAAVVAGGRNGEFEPAVEVLSVRPGLLLKHIDLILRRGDGPSVERLLSAFQTHVGRISGRNLLNLDQHLANRTAVQGNRIFVNRHGRGHARPEPLPVLTPVAIAPFRAAVRAELLRRLPARDVLVVDGPSLAGVAVPISEKSKSDGFAVLPRGSVFPVASGPKRALRFFFYWKQRQERTDYDLSCAFYDAKFNLVTQVSWTNLRSTEANPAVIHSGDFTDATHGATEFIDIDLARLDARVAYLLPTINFFTGEGFDVAEEAFFGFMERPAGDRGLPFEARTVTTKFALKGAGRVCVPMVFVRAADGMVSGKWLDLYVSGLSWANAVENNRFTTIGLAKAMLEKSFTPLSDLVDLHRERASRVLAATDPLPDTPVTYIGLRRPDRALPPGSTVITLESFRSLIPA